MPKVIDLQDYRTKSAGDRGFEPWCKRFGESYGAETRLSDLSDRTLYFLAQPGEETAMAFYELIMGILGLGAAPKFYYLPNEEQMTVMDIHLFLADQVRLEMMHRLEWLTGFSGMTYSILDMVHDAQRIKMECKEKAPTLSQTDPDLQAYEKLVTADKHAFVRRRLRQALEAFKARLDS
ncbi:MAG: hypothetical protein SWH78_00805 [Thermodesulfobacteriota bacterium]|nr:hypothetical protein [Thermodesulfobacteriota bacterium]